MPKQTLIVPGYARNDVMKSLLGKQSLLFGTELLTLGSYKSSLVYRELNKNEERARLFASVRNHIRKENLYRDQLKFPVFFQYFYDFASLLARYGIKAEDLPDTDADKKEILQYLLGQNLCESQTAASFRQIKDASDIAVFDCFYPDHADAREIETLVQKGARLVFPREKKNTVFTCRTANNNVREVIGAAQYLIRQKDKPGFDLQDYALLVNDKENYIPVIRRVFEYYKIPYMVTVRRPNAEAGRFLALLELIRNQDVPSFVNAYNQKVFTRREYVLTEYIGQFELTYDQLCRPFERAANLLNDASKKEFVENTFGSRDIRKLEKKEAACEEIMRGIREILTSEEFVSLKGKTLRQQCAYAYDTLYGKTEEEIPAEKMDEIQQVHDLTLAAAKQKGDGDTLFELLRYELENAKTEQKICYEKGISVSDPYQCETGCKHAIILGCTQQNYPQNIAQNGFFDEQYTENIPGFPSLVERNETFSSGYDRFLRGFEEVIFSYPAAGVNGDQFQRSALIADYAEKDAEHRVIEYPWPYTEIESYFRPEEKISPASAKKIYMKNGRLRASPSALSSYVGCPFQYFIERGLGLQDEEPLAIGSNTIGSIQHSLLERYFRDEIDLTEDNLEESLEPYFEVMKELMINGTEEIDAMKTRLAWGFVRSLRFLKDFRAKDTYHYAPEEPVNYRFEIGGYPFELNGKIDRLDTDAQNYRIIDYKSSEKEVKIENVKKGINFQLLAYLVFYYLKTKEETGTEMIPELFAYFSMKNKTISAKEEDPRHAKTDEELRKEDARYAAYLTKDVSVDEEMFTVENKAGKGNIDVMDFGEITEVLKKLYEAIAQRILSGRIAIEPTDRHCVFCNYSDICHHDKEDTLNKTEMETLVQEEEE